MLTGIRNNSNDFVIPNTFISGNADWMYINNLYELSDLVKEYETRSKITVQHDKEDRLILVFEDK